MEDKITQLYDAIILHHNRLPFGFEKRPAAQHILEAYNPLCGDKFKLYIDLQAGRVVLANFFGYGCAISKAATSVLTQKILGQPIEQVQEIISTYFLTLNTEGVENDELMMAHDEFKSFAMVQQFPERLTCATLSWVAAQDFFNTQFNNPITQ